MRHKRTIIRLMILLGGLYAAGMGLWQLGNSAIFVHEAVVIPGVVVDVRERPFEDITEMLAHGNLPWEGAVAHQPHVRYDFAGLSRVDQTLPDLDNHDYNRGEAVEIILHPQQPHQRHINKFKFVWGEHLIMLGLGLCLLLLWRLVRPRRRHSIVKQAARRARDKVAQAAADAVVESVLPAASKGNKSAGAQLALDLVEAVTESAPKKRRRTSKPKDPNAPAKPRRSSKSATAAPTKRRRKTKDATQG